MVYLFYNWCSATNWCHHDAINMYDLSNKVAMFLIPAKENAVLAVYLIVRDRYFSSCSYMKYNAEHVHELQNMGMAYIQYV